MRVTNRDVDTGGFEENEKAFITGHRWWALDELAASDEEFSPTTLVQHLRQLLDGGHPGRAIDVGV